MKKEIKIIWSICFIALISVLLSNCTEIYYRIIPISHWIEYSDIKLIKPALVGERIGFISHRNIHYRSNLSFENVLMCFDNDRGQYAYYIKHSAKNFNAKKSVDEKAIWYFNEIINTEKSCYLVSDINLHLPYGIIKTKTFVGDKFNVECCSEN